MTKGKLADMMSKWRRYEELERIHHLKEEGRELLGEICYVEEKQDGSNVSLWLEPNGQPHISSHNMVNADPDIVSKLQTTKEYERAIQFLKDEREQYNHEFILFGELRRIGKSPTRIEKHKKTSWSLFDIWDMKNGEWLAYPLIYQYAYHWKIPTVKLLETFTPYKMEEIPDKIASWKKWAKRHRREGVVGKVYKKGEMIAWKEKIDLPDLPAETREHIQKSTYPPMPEATVLRALQHSWDEVQEVTATRDEGMSTMWNDRKIVMPIIAKHLANEAREHLYNPPKDFYTIYLNTSIEKIKERHNDTQQ